MDRQFGHSDVRLVRVPVFPGQRVRKIGVEQNVNSLPLQQESALPQPPQTKTSVAPIRRMNVREQGVVGLNRLDHESPSSPRTMFTPRTIFANFWRAAQRAVWLSPQSGAKESFSAGAYFRQRRTRSATSSGVSM